MNLGTMTCQDCLEECQRTSPNQKRCVYCRKLKLGQYTLSCEVCAKTLEDRIGGRKTCSEDCRTHRKKMLARKWRREKMSPETRAKMNSSNRSRYAKKSTFEKIFTCPNCNEETERRSARRKRCDPCAIAERRRQACYGEKKAAGAGIASEIMTRVQKEIREMIA